MWCFIYRPCSLSLPYSFPSLGVASSIQALTDLTVAHEVCLELCLPFWKCPALGQKNQRPIAKIAPPELNNNRKKLTNEQLKNHSCGDPNGKKEQLKENKGNPTKCSSSSKGCLGQSTTEKSKSSECALPTSLPPPPPPPVVGLAAAKEGHCVSSEGEGHYEKIGSVTPAVSAMTFYSEGSSGGCWSPRTVITIYLLYFYFLLFSNPIL